MCAVDELRMAPGTSLRSRIDYWMIQSQPQQTLKSSTQIASKISQIHLNYSLFTFPTSPPNFLESHQNYVHHLILTQLKFVRTRSTSNAHKSFIEISHVCPKGVRLLPFCMSFRRAGSSHMLDVCQMCNKWKKYRFTNIHFRAESGPSRRFEWIIILSPNVITVQGDKCVSRAVFKAQEVQAQKLVSLPACVGINPRIVIFFLLMN